MSTNLSKEDLAITATLTNIKGSCSPAHKSIPLKEISYTIGRWRSNQIVFNSVQVSRYHACLAYRVGKWFLKDSSTNGIFVNGAKLEKNKWKVLNNDDGIEIIPGILEYRINYHNAALAIASGTSPNRISECPGSSDSASSDQDVYFLEEIIKSSPIPILSRTLPVESKVEVPNEQHSATSSLQTTSSSSTESAEVSVNGNVLECLNGQNGSLRIELEARPDPEVETGISSKRAVSIEDLECTEHKRVCLTVLQELTPAGGVEFSDQHHADEITNRVARAQHPDEKISIECSSDTALSFLRTEIDNLTQKCNRLESEKQTFENMITELRNESSSLKKEHLNQLLGILEHDFSCSICSDVFVEPTVLGCGHTFCCCCIFAWAVRKTECPICRKGITAKSKHIEMINFLNHAYELMPDEIVSKRKKSTQEHAIVIMKLPKPNHPPRAPERIIDVLTELQFIINSNQVPIQRRQRGRPRVRSIPQTNVSVRLLNSLPMNSLISPENTTPPNAASNN